MEITILNSVLMNEVGKTIFYFLRETLPVNVFQGDIAGAVNIRNK